MFHYNNINAFLIGVALSEALKCDLGEFIVKEIFDPLHITRYELTYSPEGYFYGASGMKLCVHDLSKIGLLMSNGGEYNGKRIVSEEYVKLATSIQQMSREGGYGFFFWKYKDGFSINGKWKQKCYCLPKQGLVITYLAHIEDDSHDLLNSMENSILAKIGIDGVSLNLATAIRTMVVVVMAWGMVFLTHSQNGIYEISRKSWIFLVLSGLATGASWLCYYKALQIGEASKVVPIDKLRVVITLILAFVFLHEEFTAKSLIG